MGRSVLLAILCLCLSWASVEGNDLITTFSVVDCYGKPVSNANVSISGCVDHPIYISTNPSGIAVTPDTATQSIQYCSGSAKIPCVFQVVSSPSSGSYTAQSLVLLNGTANGTPQEYICQSVGCCHPCDQNGGKAEPSCPAAGGSLYVNYIISFVPTQTSCLPPPSPPPACPSPPPPCPSPSPPPPCVCPSPPPPCPSPPPPCPSPAPPVSPSPPPPPRSPSPPPPSPSPPPYPDVTGETCFAFIPPLYIGGGISSTVPVVSVSLRDDQKNDIANGITLTSGTAALNQSPTVPPFVKLTRNNRWGWEQLFNVPSGGGSFSTSGTMYCGQNIKGGYISVTLTANTLTYTITMPSTSFTAGDVHVYASCSSWPNVAVAPGQFNCNPSKASCGFQLISSTDTSFSASMDVSSCSGGQLFTMFHLSP